jgi:sigma-B regulation protein RsbU (phosphoserine phosphatase)
VLETINKTARQFALKALTTILHKAHTQNAKEIATTIRDTVQDFVGTSKHHDDQTVLVLKAKL